MNTQYTAMFFLIFSYMPITQVFAEEYFNVSLKRSILTITPSNNPKAPNKQYNPGIKILSPGFTVSQCTPTSNQFCSFSASTHNPAHLNISGPSGDMTFILCLNPNQMTANCETHHLLIPAIIFITQNTYSGDLNGVMGADLLCNSEAYQAGSQIPPGHLFKALLLSPTRYPCSNPKGDNSGRCNDRFANDWPLTPDTIYYQPDGVTVFNTVNKNGVFDGEIVNLQDIQGHVSAAQFWFGLQSVHSSPDGFHIDAWAFDDMNPEVDQNSYISNLAYCQNWSSASASIHGSVGSSGRIQGNLNGPVFINQWGNYYNFQDNSLNYLFNIFNISAYYTCDGPASLVCVG